MFFFVYRFHYHTYSIDGDWRFYLAEMRRMNGWPLFGGLVVGLVVWPQCVRVCIMYPLCTGEMEATTFMPSTILCPLLFMLVTFEDPGRPPSGSFGS